MREITIKIHEIAKDGLPPDMSESDMEAENDPYTGRIAFIVDGAIVSGIPATATTWEANREVGRMGSFEGVTHWIEFPVPIEDLNLPA